jgi:nucleoside-diphosphate-sugar epimerase
VLVDCEAIISIIAGWTLMRSLITGATGFLGSRLAEVLIADGETVRLFVRDRRRLRGDLAGHYDIIEGDLADLAALQRAIDDIDVVFHCAANT